MDDSNPPENPGFAMPAAWIVLAVLVSLIVCGGVGFAGYGSESAGVSAATWGAFPLGFALSAALGALVVHFAVRRSTVVRVAAPFGCGCLGGTLMALLVAVFFAAIFPAL